MTTITYTAPPTCARFMKSPAFQRFILGPVGSAKTTTCIFELLRRSLEQERAQDGYRYTRFAIVRQTLKQLKDTVLKDIQSWLDGICAYKVTDQAIYVTFGDVRSEWLLIPLDDPDDQRRLLSMQLTGAWLSEAIEMSTDIIAPLAGRLGRYPSGKLGKPTWFGMIGDTNFPTEGDKWHELFEHKTPPDMEIFKQPGGLEPDAENIENLPGGREYYERLSRGRDEAWIERYVNAKYGTDPSGSAVFRTSFKRSFHVSDEVVEPVHGYPLIVSQDFGRNPCGLVGQLDHKGRVLILKELIAEDIGLELHLQRNLKPALMDSRFVGRSLYVVGDPAGNQRSTSYEETSFDLIKREGLHAYPAPTNDIDKRLRAVESYLLAQRDGGPALLIDGVNCPTLVLALNGKYRYAKRKNGQLNNLPDKSHPWSDIADALQYLCLVAHGGFSGYAVNRMQRAQRPAVLRPRPSKLAWT